jgi:hypothetical protein
MLAYVFFASIGIFCACKNNNNIYFFSNQKLRSKKESEWNLFSKKLAIGEFFANVNMLASFSCWIFSDASRFRDNPLKQSALVFLGLSIYGVAAHERFLKISTMYTKHDAKVALAEGQALEKETRSSILFKYHPAFLFEDKE